MHPEIRKVLGDRVGLVPQGDYEFVLRPLGAAFAGAGVTDDLSIGAVVNIRSGFFVAAAPSAEADHAVELFPVSPTVIRGVDKIQNHRNHRDNAKTEILT